MKPISGIIILLLLIIISVNLFGYLAFVEVRITNKLLLAGQEQIAGFMMVPGPQQTGPITIFYDVAVDKNEKKHKEVNKKAQPKNTKGTK